MFLADLIAKEDEVNVVRNVHLINSSDIVLAPGIHHGD